MHRLLLQRPLSSAASLRRHPSRSSRSLHASQLHIASRIVSARPSQTSRPLSVLLSGLSPFPASSASCSSRWFASQPGPGASSAAGSAQDVGQLLAAASAGDVDKMRDILDRNTCTVNDGDYDRRKVTAAAQHSTVLHTAHTALLSSRSLDCCATASVSVRLSIWPLRRVAWQQFSFCWTAALR